MKRLTATARITIGLASVNVSILLAAYALGLLPDERRAVIEGRADLCEAVALESSLLASSGDTQAIELLLAGLVQHNDGVLSAALYNAEGVLIANAGSMPEIAADDASFASSASLMRVPIRAGSEPWGCVDIRFEPIEAGGLWGVLQMPLVRTLAFTSLVGLVVFYFFLRRTLQYLDPSKVVPERVRAALDSLAGGLLLMDQEERIVLANRSFAQTVRRNADELQGGRPSNLTWRCRAEDGSPCDVVAFPWSEALQSGEARHGVLLELSEAENERTFLVNAAPITGGNGATRGVLASFDDVTLLEQKKRELAEMLEVIKSSRDQIHKKNEELQILATRDPLTSCLNRRSFFEIFDKAWEEADQHSMELSAVMVDVDFFKSINDNHGHSVGDDVLRGVSKLLREVVGPDDHVCRYGGEEFCVLMPGAHLDRAAEAAERIRSAIEADEIGGLSITASLGVSSRSENPTDPQGLLDQADKCLYAAKRNGRNRVERWDQVPDNIEVDESQVSRTAPGEIKEGESSIPFPAVLALISALSFRDVESGEHSRRVADLCAEVAGRMMSVRDAYIVEVAGLLHDIGKIGVPDAMLLKPSALTKSEQASVQMHLRYGVELLQNTFSNEKLTEIVRTYKAWYAGNAADSGLPSGDDLPVGARLLAIADAYDAMISHHSYRDAMTPDEAFAELRRCAGQQFDPEMVEQFIEIVSDGDEKLRRGGDGGSKQAALSIGLQIERLAAALDQRDIAGLAALAGRLRITARQEGMPEVADVAHRLEQCAASDPDVMRLVEITRELLDVCRTSQGTVVDETDGVRS